MNFPLLYPVEQVVDHPTVANPAAEVRKAILESKLSSRIPKGGRVAVAVGSRGIAQLAVLVRSAVDTLKGLGYHAFIVAAMGSHGGATSEGQRQLLASYDITPQTVGVPISTAMEVVQIGTNSWGEPVYWDREAHQADGVITISRIKPHTDFRGSFESGIVKMLVIGLGKREGAATHHQYGARGLRDMIPESAKVILSRTNFALGIAVLENAREGAALIRGVEPEDLFQVEPQLLERARELMARLPFEELDLLVVGELGKNYSGTGMDVNVLGRQLVEGEPDSFQPRITRICVLDLSPESHGNAVGLGLADLTTQRLLARMDEHVTNMNYFTACFMLRAKIPPALPTDRACIEMGMRTCWQPHLDRLRLAIIPNTLELTHLWVSAAVAKECRQQRSLKVGGEPVAVEFASDDRLEMARLFPHSLLARRKLDT